MVFEVETDPLPKFYQLSAISHSGGNPLFVLDDSLFLSIKWEDAFDTVCDMNKAGLLELPAPAIDIRFRLGAIFDNEDHPLSDTKMLAEIADLREAVDIARLGFGVRLYNLSGVKGADSLPNDTEAHLAKTAVLYLWAALATRNIEKSVFTRKPGKFQSNGQPKHTHVTTLKVPKVKYLHPESGYEATGRTVRAHFRRGHIREQPYGPGRVDRKRIWIEPMFVAADDDFVPQRKEYRVVA